MFIGIAGFVVATALSFGEHPFHHASAVVLRSARVVSDGVMF